MTVAYLRRQFSVRWLHNLYPYVFVLKYLLCDIYHIHEMCTICPHLMRITIF